jgi:hypothetical protein
MPRTIKLRQEAIIDNQSLVCPYCDGDNLRQRRTEVFIRNFEDDPRGVQVLVEREGVIEGHDMQDNPSQRLNGLKLHFTCGDCLQDFVLNIAEHKGCTQIFWSEP